MLVDSLLGIEIVVCEVEEPVDVENESDLKVLVDDGTKESDFVASVFMYSCLCVRPNSRTNEGGDRVGSIRARTVVESEGKSERVACDGLGSCEWLPVEMRELRSGKAS